jgi:hypothetical protein
VSGKMSAEGQGRWNGSDGSGQRPPLPQTWMRRTPEQTVVLAAQIRGLPFGMLRPLQNFEGMVFLSLAYLSAAITAGRSG